MVEAKLKRVLRPAIVALEAKRRVLARIGDYAAREAEEIELQQKRIANLEWALGEAKDDDEIRGRLEGFAAQLTPDELDCKYGVVRGLPMGTVLLIAQVEDLEVALGTHPAIAGEGEG